ncbi:hypothetical protein BGZ82_004102, partial [Podila clonocystis]
NYIESSVPGRPFEIMKFAIVLALISPALTAVSRCTYGSNTYVKNDIVRAAQISKKPITGYQSHLRASPTTSCEWIIVESAHVRSSS